MSRRKKPKPASKQPTVKFNIMAQTWRRVAVACRKDGFDKIADSIANSLEDERFMGVVRRLLDLGVDPVAKGESEKGPLTGMSFCLTGKLFEPRARIQELIRAAGGEVHSAVKKGTGYLVTGEKVGKSKIEKARAAGTEVIDEETLMGMIPDE